MTEKRADHISWPDYFMGIAILSAHRSKDPNSQVGACIVSPKNKIVGIGYKAQVVETAPESPEPKPKGEPTEQFITELTTTEAIAALLGNPDAGRARRDPQVTSFVENLRRPRGRAVARDRSLCRCSTPWTSRRPPAWKIRRLPRRPSSAKLPSRTRAWAR